MKEFISRLTWVDYIALIAVLRGVYVGYKSGFFPELLRIVAYLATVLVTLQFHEDVAQYLTLKTFLNHGTASLAAFVGLLGLVFLAAKLVMMLLLKLLKIGDGGALNKLLGAVLGAGRWVLLISLLFMAIEHSPLSTLKTDVQTRSVMGQDIARIAPTLFDFLSTLSPRLAIPKNAA